MVSQAPAAGACLGDDTIAGMLEGVLADDHARRARAHIATCATCRRLVSAAIDGHGRQAATTVQVVTALRDGIAPGLVIANKYRIERVLGEGGMGRVFAARQLGLDRAVAIKILRPELARDGMALARFQREARLVAALASEHVIRVHDSGALETGEPYLVMEWLDGEDLATIVQRGPVRTDFAVSWILAACRALGESHTLGIVHRDIKPSNLFVTTTGRLVVLDFGLAKLAARDAGATMTADGVMLGSPRYMAPEQIRGARDAGVAADIWGLGATLYHLVTGTPPFDAPTIEAVFSKILAGQMPDLANLPPVVAGVVRRALAFDPASRFATVDDLAAALEARLPEERCGVSIERYQPIELLGQGGHGAVYRARQLPNGREVALKVLTASGHGVRERFAREAAIVQHLEHPNTVRLFEYGIGGDGAPYMVFELVRGRTLASEIARGPMHPARVARIATQTLKALSEAHDRGIVHRDVTPSNIQLVDHAGEPDFVKLLDFGVAIDSAAPSLTATGHVVGTPRYMAPEQVTGAAVDARCDLYALGLVMAEALVGAPVYAGDSAMATCIQQASLDPVPLPPAVLAGPLGTVIAKATTKPQHGRFASAREMLAAIGALGTLGTLDAVGAVGAVGAVRAVRAIGAMPSPPTDTNPAAAVAPPARTVTLSVRTLAIATACLAVLGVGIALAVIQPWNRDATDPVAQTEPRATIRLGTENKGKVIIGDNVEFGSKPLKEPPPATSGSGPLGNLDESRLRRRLTQLGWTIKEVDRQSFPECDHIRFQCERGERAAGTYAWADIYLLQCFSRVDAFTNRSRLQKHPGSWAVDDGNLVLMVTTNTSVGSDEKRAKALFDQLVVP